MCGRVPVSGGRAPAGGSGADAGCCAPSGAAGAAARSPAATRTRCCPRSCEHGARRASGLVHSSRLHFFLLRKTLSYIFNRKNNNNMYQYNLNACAFSTSTVSNVIENLYAQES